MRLIDADELKKQAYKSGDWDKPLVVDVEAIDDAPTVDRWHYPSKGELPTEVGRYFCKIKSEYAGWNNDWYEAVGWTGKYWILNDDEQVVAWQYITPPKEEA